MGESRLGFKIEAEATGTRARAARFRTLHGEVLTPLFMPVGTRATVRGQTSETLAEAGSQILLANTFHLLRQPGLEVFRKMGGIQKLMNWPGSVLTDSGGYQIFSLPGFRTITEEGATFKDHPDRAALVLTPESSIEAQIAIGSDIMMALDTCVPSTCSREEALEAVERTTRWAARSLRARGEAASSIFGIVQGACVPELRRQSAAELGRLAFDGFAIGGLAVGEGRSEREDMTELTAALLPRELPRYLMGVGTPIDLLEAVHRGMDMFDCIWPTAIAQQGVAYTSRGRVTLRRGVYKFSEEKLDPACECPTCVNHSRAYLHHLTKAKEILVWHLVGQHNLHFYHRLMTGMRRAIFEDRFVEFRRAVTPSLENEDESFPVTRPVRRAPAVQPETTL